MFQLLRGLKGPQARLLRSFPCHGKQNNFHRQESHIQGRSGWPYRTSLPTVSAILISFHITVKPRHPGRKPRAVDATRIAFVEGASL